MLQMQWKEGYKKFYWPVNWGRPTNLFRVLPSHARTKAQSRGKVAVPNFLSEKQVPSNAITPEIKVIPILNTQNHTIDRFLSVLGDIPVNIIGVVNPVSV